MTQMQLLKKLDEWDEKGSWGLTMDRFYMYFHNESKESIKKALVRHEQSGLLERICKGIYANPRALSKTRVYNKLAYISNFIRDKGLSYLSLETVLSENNIISQSPNRYTFISKGQSRVFYTPYGIIEYTHTKRKTQNLHSNCYFDENREIWVAKTQQAIKDAFEFNRCVDLLKERQKRI